MTRREERVCMGRAGYMMLHSTMKLLSVQTATFLHIDAPAHGPHAPGDTTPRVAVHDAGHDFGHARRGGYSVMTPHMSSGPGFEVRDARACRGTQVFALPSVVMASTARHCRPGNEQAPETLSRRPASFFQKGRIPPLPIGALSLRHVLPLHSWTICHIHSVQAGRPAPASPSP